MTKKLLEGNICAFSHHKKCVSRAYMNHPALSDFRIIATGLTDNLDWKGPGEFVTLFENTKLGWFGIQCHPEKAKYEFGRPE